MSNPAQWYLFKATVLEAAKTISDGLAKPSWAILNYNRCARACYGRKDQLTAQLLDFESTMEQILLDSSRRTVFIEAFSITVTALLALSPA